MAQPNAHACAETDQTGTCNVPDATTGPGLLLKKLRSLARPNARARLIEGTVKIETERTSKSDGQAPAPTSEIALPDWQELMRRGWVVEHESRDGWRLSNAGAIALKRNRSRGGEPSSSRDGGKCNNTITGNRQVRAPRQEPHYHRPGHNDCESPLGWLSRRRDRNGKPLISQTQYSAGERLRADFTYGSMMPSMTTNWSPMPGSPTRYGGSDKELELHDGQLLARDRFRAALAGVGPEFANVLVDVCCHLKGLEEVERASGWPQRSAKIVLLLALTALARHYGFMERRDATSANQAT
ncbi:MAG: DUF6456 domain-containing protein [Filomicrobium sp.]